MRGAKGRREEVVMVARRREEEAARREDRGREAEGSRESWKHWRLL